MVASLIHLATADANWFVALARMSVQIMFVMPKAIDNKSSNLVTT